MARAKIEYWQAKNGKWYFHRRATNGQITDPSQGYSTASNARRAIRKRWHDPVIVKVSAV